MNFLQLAQRLARECGVAGTGPAAVAGQANEAGRLVNYVADAWVEIQGLHDVWKFMQAGFTAPILAGASQVTKTNASIADTHRVWKTDSLRCYRTATGVADEMWIVEWDWDELRDTYRFGAQTPGRPVVFAVKPDDESLQLAPALDVDYTIVGEYWKKPIRLAADSDTPAIDDSLHMIVVYKAMEFYGLYEAATEVMARGEKGFARLLAQMERRYLPDMVKGGALA